MQAPAIQIDWSLPLVAVPTERFKGGKLPAVKIPPKWAIREDARAVQFDQNIWVERGPAGVWYFDQSGYAVAGIGPDGYEARFTIANA